MHNTLILLSSVIALITLSHAAAIRETPSCTAVQHIGQLTIFRSTDPTRFTTAIGNIAPTTNGYNFPMVADTTYGSGAIVLFWGCPGGGAFWLYCMNCTPGGYDSFGVTNNGYETNGEPDHWVLYNHAHTDTPIQSLPTREEYNATRRNYIESFTFKWDADATFIRPVTYNNDMSENTHPLFAQKIIYNNFQYSPSVGSDGYYYALWFNEDPNNDLGIGDGIFL